MSNVIHKYFAVGAALFLVPMAVFARRATVPSDFDGDGKSDLAVYFGDAGMWYVNRSSSGAMAQSQWGWNESEPVTGDFDGDGRADIAVYSQQFGTWFILQSSNGQARQVQLGGDGYKPVPADYDGDGKTDVAVYRRDTGEWSILQSSNGQLRKNGWGWAQARPVPADYDGDGKADLAVFDRKSGNWYLWLSTGPTKVVNWGWRDVRPVPADYDGDGKADLAVYFGQAGDWYILQSSNGQMRKQNWGFPQARAVPGDYDGDGKTDLAVYCRKTGNWYVLPSSTGIMRQQNFGWSGAAALPTYHDGGVNGEIILAFGDSITYGTSSASNGPDTGYPILLERRLNTLQGGHFATVNAGHPGDQTSDGLARLPSALTSAQPDLMLLMMGTNDEFFKQPFSVTANNLITMIAMAQQSGAKVMLATIPPVIKSASHDRTQQEQLIEQFNPYIYQIGQLMGVAVVPVWESITSVPNWQNTLIDPNTANHPNDAGYQVVRDAFYKVIDQNMQNGNLW